MSLTQATANNTNGVASVKATPFAFHIQALRMPD